MGRVEETGANTRGVVQMNFEEWWDTMEPYLDCPYCPTRYAKAAASEAWKAGYRKGKMEPDDKDYEV